MDSLTEHFLGRGVLLVAGQVARGGDLNLAGERSRGPRSLRARGGDRLDALRSSTLSTFWPPLCFGGSLSAPPGSLKLDPGRRRAGLVPPILRAGPRTEGPYFSPWVKRAERGVGHFLSLSFAESFSSCFIWFARGVASLDTLEFSAFGVDRLRCLADNCFSFVYRLLNILAAIPGELSTSRSFGEDFNPAERRSRSVAGAAEGGLRRDGDDSEL